jgi:hypothetical protein
MNKFYAIVLISVFAMLVTELYRGFNDLSLSDTWYINWARINAALIVCVILLTLLTPYFKRR